jgi:hypothetical protein
VDIESSVDWAPSSFLFPIANHMQWGSNSQWPRDLPSDHSVGPLTIAPATV